jgi:hypothetical protein
MESMLCFEFGTVHLKFEGFQCQEKLVANNIKLGQAALWDVQCRFAWL